MLSPRCQHNSPLPGWERDIPLSALALCVPLWVAALAQCWQLIVFNHSEARAQVAPSLEWFLWITATSTWYWCFLRWASSPLLAGERRTRERLISPELHPSLFTRQEAFCTQVLPWLRQVSELRVIDECKLGSQRVEIASVSVSEKKQNNERKILKEQY